MTYFELRDDKGNWTPRISFYPPKCVLDEGGVRRISPCNGISPEIRNEVQIAKKDALLPWDHLIQAYSFNSRI